jgi:hypothetical protein
MGRRSSGAVEAAVGYAVDRRGQGIAYVRVVSPGGRHLMRVGFSVHRPAEGREGDYAAVGAVLSRLLNGGATRVTLLLADAGLIDEMTGRAEVSERCVLAHLRLRCTVNQFDRCEFRIASSGEVDDLVQRARAEAALHSAA